MVLVDTSVWIAHLRKSEPVLVDLLSNDLVSTHPFVIGELACGNLRKREETLSHFAALPRGVEADDAEVMQLIERRRLWGRGLGWTDVHLLTSAVLSGSRFWTLDRRLEAVARELNLAV